MKINYNVKGDSRKKLVAIIAEAITEKSEYLGTPTYAYKIGAFTVTREGVLEFDSAATDEVQIKSVIDSLQEAGFTYDGSDSLSIGYPLDGFTPQTLDNLHQIVKSKEVLFKKALGIDQLPIEQGETELTFAWFRAGLSREDVFAYSQFITQICKAAKTKKRVTARPQESYDNEAFTMRTFLVNLGMVGAEFAYCRKLMIKNLDGNSAYRYSKPDGESKSRRERIHKEVISIRLTPETLQKLEELASQTEGNMSRNRLIEAVIEEYIQTEYTSPETADLPPTEVDCGEENKVAESTEEPPEENPT